MLHLKVAEGFVLVILHNPILLGEASTNYVGTQGYHAIVLLVESVECRIFLLFRAREIDGAPLKL